MTYNGCLTLNEEFFGEVTTDVNTNNGNSEIGVVEEGGTEDGTRIAMIIVVVVVIMLLTVMVFYVCSRACPKRGRVEEDRGADEAVRIQGNNEQRDYSARAQREQD